MTTHAMTLAHSDPQRTGTARPVPVWVNRLAHLAALTTVPSGIWRILLGFGIPMGFSQQVLTDYDMPGWGTLYVVALSVSAEAASLLTLGLVRRWGEVFPEWVPILGGRRVPVPVAVVPAALGAITLVWLWTPLLQDLPGVWGESVFGGDLGPSGGWAVLMAASYLPLLLWGPMLAVVTAAYWWRRRQERTPR